MLDLGWSELVVVAVIALIVVGPKELPALLRTIAQIVKALRSQANEFRGHFDNAMKDTGLEDIRSELQHLKSDAAATMRDAQREFEKEVEDLNEIGRELKGEAKHTGANGASAPEIASAKRNNAEDAMTSDERTYDDWMQAYNQSLLDAEKSAAAHDHGAPGASGENQHDTAKTQSGANAGAHADDKVADKAGAAT